MLIMAIGKIINDNFDQIFNMYNSSVSVSYTHLKQLSLF